MAAPTQFQVFRLIVFAPKIDVCQNNHLPGNSFDQRQKLLVGNVRRFDRPISDESELISQQTEFSADNPFPCSKAFASDSLSFGLVIFPNRVTQLNAVGINHAEDGRLGKKFSGQFPMCFQLAGESGSFRQSGKQSPPVLPPTIKLMLRCAFQSKQQAQSNEFADGKFSLNMFLRLWQHIIYTTKKFYDKVFLSHGIDFLCEWFRHLHSRNFSVTFSTSTNG